MEEVGRKFIAQYTRSFFLSKGILKGVRILVILYEFIAVLVDYIKNWDGGVAFPRDFTGLVMLMYFTVCICTISPQHVDHYYIFSTQCQGHYQSGQSRDCLSSNSIIGGSDYLL
jgi:hypothetical protein